MPGLTLLETGAPALPQTAAATGPGGFSAGAAINYRTRECKCLCGGSDKGEQCLAGGSGLSLGGENINTGKEAQYLNTLRKREGFPPIFVFPMEFRDWEKLDAFKAIVPPRLTARARSISDSSQGFHSNISDCCKCSWKTPVRGYNPDPAPLNQIPKGTYLCASVISEKHLSTPSARV